MTTTAPLSNDYDQRAAQVAALVAARKAKLEFEKTMAGIQVEKIKPSGGMLFKKDDTVYEEAPKDKDFDQFRVGGSKGKEGRADHTRGKSAFKRPCTVGWKSQNQPLSRGGGGRTPL